MRQKPQTLVMRSLLQVREITCFFIAGLFLISIAIPDFTYGQPRGRVAGLRGGEVRGVESRRNGQSAEKLNLDHKTVNERILRGLGNLQGRSYNEIKQRASGLSRAEKRCLK